MGRVSIKVGRLRGLGRVWRPSELAVVSGSTLRECKLKGEKTTSACQVRFSCERLTLIDRLRFVRVRAR